MLISLKLIVPVNIDMVVVFSCPDMSYQLPVNIDMVVVFPVP